MKTAVGAPDPGEFERNQPHNLFNDRRAGGKAKNRAFFESNRNPQKPVKKAAASGNTPPRDPNKNQFNRMQKRKSK